MTLSFKRMLWNVPSNQIHTKDKILRSQVLQKQKERNNSKKNRRKPWLKEKGQSLWHWEEVQEWQPNLNSLSKFSNLHSKMAKTSKLKENFLQLHHLRKKISKVSLYSMLMSTLEEMRRLESLYSRSQIQKR
jgi:hypothetical protein